MAGILRKLLPVGSSSHGQEEEEVVDDRYNSIECSFAVEYTGPLVTYAVPRAAPVDIKQIPIAAAASVHSWSLLSDMSFPVIQPIAKSNKKQSKLPKSGSGGNVSLCQNGVFGGNDMPREPSNRVDESTVLWCAKDELATNLTNGVGSSGRLVLCDGCSDDNNENAGQDFQGYMNPAHCESIESENSCSNSSEIFSGQEEDRNEEAPGHVRRPSIVTFRESNDVVEDESDVSDTDGSVPERQMAVRPGKKGTCYRCMKGNRLTEKEVCIVCGAKYCSSCVIRAMGSMPEGRKCVTCIGQRIYEARRKNLGKCSRMLKQLLSGDKVKHVMMSERVCPVNQLPPELIYVNQQRLSKEELCWLQTCPYPPKGLKPGHYWYDKVSGFWGKEGQKPCQIISPQLNVGGHIQQDASNGDTNIMINNRKITKSELLMLKLAGVNLEGATHLWVSADGSYQEEGMNNVKGKIWTKFGAKLICAVLSLPSPPSSESPSGEVVNVGNPDNTEQKTLHKLILVGSEKSGTSTIFKQAKIIYGVPYTEDERESIKSIIQINLYAYLGVLLDGRQRFEQESLIDKRRRFVDQHNCSGQVDRKTIYSIGPKLKSFSDWLLEVMVLGNLESVIPTATCKYSHFVEELWRDAAIQATYDRRSELELLPRVATYFLERAVEIARSDYVPSDMDILYAEGINSSKGLCSMEFSFAKSDQEGCENIGYQHDPLLRYQLIRVHPRTLGGNCKWLEMFEDVDMVLFCVSLTHYDELSEDNNGVVSNKMMASKQLFERIVTHPTFEEKKFLLIFNKFDLLEEKIERVPLARCEWFHDFNPVIGCNLNGRNTNPSLALRAFQFIAVKFKRLFHSLTDRKLYVSLANGLEADNVDEALKYAREILKWNQEEPNYGINPELSSTSIDASSSS